MRRVKVSGLPSRSGGAASRPPAPARTGPAHQLLRLQREAGNQAVAGLVQRAPGDKPDFTQNDVHLKAEGVVRRRVTGLKYGLKGGWQGKYGDEKKDESFEAKKTGQTPKHSAVVIFPEKLGAGPVQVILHFHGYGFRNHDPYAGFATSKAGKTRDYHQEHWEQQTGQVGKERAAANAGLAADQAQPSIVTILAQGRGKSDFGEVPTFDYIADVLSKVPELSGVKQYSLIQTGHSGGGGLLRKAVHGGQAATAARGALPAAKAGQAAPQPADMIVMLDAIAMLDVTRKGKDDKSYKILGIASWALAHIARLNTEIRAALKAGRPADAQAAIRATPKLRAYYVPGGSYATAHTTAAGLIRKAIAEIPEPYASQSAEVTVSDLFRIVPVAGTAHESLISKGTTGKEEDGAIADALRASLDPRIDRPAAPPATGSKAQPAIPATTPAPATKAPATKGPPAQGPPAQGPATKAPATQGPATNGPPTQEPATKGSAPAPAPATKAPSPAPTAAVAGAPATAEKVTTATAAATKGWKASGAAGDYKVTQAHLDTIAVQTPEERKADVKTWDEGQKRLVQLVKAEKAAKRKKGELSEADAKEMADLKESLPKVGARMKPAQRALRHQDVELILKSAGHTVDGWYGGVQSGKFLNVKVRVHQHMAEALQRAENALVSDTTANPDKLDAVALGRKLGMADHASDMRVPKAAVGGSSISMHTFGLAVDLNYTGNPYLGNADKKVGRAVIKRASGLVGNAPVDILTSLGSAKQSFDKLAAASGALVTYLSFRKDENREALRAAIAGHTAAKGEPTDEAGWVKQIEKDHAAITKSADFKRHTSPEKGFMDFQESVVMALAGAGLYWGGEYGRTKDLMHFDLRSGEGAKIHNARTSHRTSQ